MTVTGNFVDSATGKPLSDVNIDFFPDGNTSNTPYASYSSDASGNYSFTSSLLDTESNPLLNVQYPGYQQVLGGPAAFQGQVPVTPATVDIAGTTVNTGVIIAVVVVVLLIVGYFYFTKKSLKSIL